MCEAEITRLEQRLLESEKERKKYQNEANRIREMMHKNQMSTRHAAQIGKCCAISSCNLQRMLNVLTISLTSFFQSPIISTAKPIRAGQSGIINRPAVAQAK